MPRIEFSRKTRRQAFDRCKGFCEGRNCGARLKTGEAEYDHILPAELGGEATLANCQVLCGVCHKAKTAGDVRRIRQADRQRDRHTGAMPPAKAKLRSAGFPKRPPRAPKPLPPRRPMFQLWPGSKQIDEHDMGSD